MAAQGTLMYQDLAVVTPGAVRGWKVGFGYVAKGTVCVVYRVRADGGVDATATEIPLLGNGRTDTNGVSAWFAGQGVTLTNTVKSLIGA